MAEETAATTAAETATEKTETATAAETATAKTFTQEELDRIVQDRLHRQKSQFGDIDELKAKAAKLDEIEASSKSDLEKANTAREKAEKAAAKVRETADTRLIHAAVLAAAAAEKATKPEHIYRLLDKDGLTIGDDGEVSGAEDAVKAFLEANPEYVGTPGSADLGARGGGGPKQLTRAELTAMTPEAVAKAQKDGLTRDIERGIS